MPFRNLCAGAAASAGLMAAFVAAPAWATPDNYAFGYSVYDNAESLTLNGATPILTNGVQGWVSDGALNTGGPDNNTNYIAGTCCFGAGNVYADYFVFSLSGVTGPVTSAALSISPYTITQDFTFVLHDATPFVGSLSDASSPNPTLYSQLGTGAILGSFAVTPSETGGPPLVFNLNATGIQDLNADILAGGTQFAISGTVLGQAGATGAAPEPSTWLLMIAGIGGVGLALRRANGRSRRELEGAVAA